LPLLDGVVLDGAELELLDAESAPLPLMFVSSYVPAVVPDCTQPVSFVLFALSLLSIEDD